MSHQWWLYDDNRSQTYHEHISSPTSVTNINVTEKLSDKWLSHRSMKTVFLSKNQLKPSKTKFRFISTFGSASFRTGYRGNESFSREMNTIKRFPICTLSTHSFSRPSNVRIRKPSIFKFWKWPKFQGIMCFEILKKFSSNSIKNLITQVVLTFKISPFIRYSLPMIPLNR